MSDWKLCLLITLLLLWKPAMWRVWIALMANSVAAGLFPPLSHVQSQNETLYAYMAIDGLSAAVVLLSPLGRAQKVIGLLFGVMMMAHVGFYWSPRESILYHYQTNYFIGWAQLACLFSWGLLDVSGRLVKHYMPRWRLFHRHAGAIR